MFEPLERRRLFHFAYVSAGTAFFPGAEDIDDVLTVERIGDVYHFDAHDGYTKDIPVSQITVGININGGSGNDTITVDPSVKVSTTLIGGAGNDTINGGLGKDNLYGNAGNDELLGNGNRDYLQGDAGNDTLSGGSKNDTLQGGTGADSLIGSAGAADLIDYSDHTLPVNLSLDGLGNDGSTNENDTLTETCENFVGGLGDDFIRGSGKPNLLRGDFGNDTLIGGSGNDTLYGDSGNDNLQGQSGNDQLFGQDTVVDTLSGGSGTDTVTKDSIDVVDSIP